MNLKRRITVLAVMTLPIGLSAARSESKAEPKPETKVEDNFKVNWTTISYTKTVSLRNPEVSEYGRQVQVPGPGRGQDVSERLSLSCEVEMLDPNFVLGISREPVVEEIVDDKGDNVEMDTRRRSPFQARYEPPRYRRKFTPPQPQPKWKTAVRSALKLPPAEGARPQWVEEVEPCRMQIDLGIGRGEQSGEKIRHVKGYFHALIAESFEYVDVPFKKSDKWIRLTPDVEVQISDAFCDESSYRLSTKARPQGGGLGITLSADSYLPERLLVQQRLIGPDGKPVRANIGISRLPYIPSGNASGSGSSMGQIEKIRFVIAVNPMHCEIPFELKDIPLPKP